MSSPEKDNVDRNVYKEMEVSDDGKLIIDKWRLLEKSKKMTYEIDRCVGCSLCMLVCPDHAIELGPIAEIAQGLIEDMPPVLIDVDKCSFCMMCETVCINSVYKIKDEKGKEIDKSEFPKLNQMWIYDEKTCKKDKKLEVCSICNEIRNPDNVMKGRHFSKEIKEVIDNCPTNSLKFNSPFKGEVILLKNQLHLCDPNGCKACVNICPTESWFIPKTAEDVVKYGKIAVNEETCMYCGACENACPEKIIIVNRKSIDKIIPEGAKNKPWINRWNKQFSNLILSKDQFDEKIKEEPKKLFISEEEIDESSENTIQISPSQNFSHDDYRKEREEKAELIDKIKDIFKKSKIMYLISRKQKDKLKKFIKKQFEK